MSWRNSPLYRCLLQFIIVAMFLNSTSLVALGHTDISRQQTLDLEGDEAARTPLSGDLKLSVTRERPADGFDTEGGDVHQGWRSERDRQIIPPAQTASSTLGARATFGWGPRYRVNDNSSIMPLDSPQATANASDGMYVAWRGAGDFNNYLLSAWQPRGRQGWSTPQQINDDLDTPLSNFAFASDSQDNIYAVWKQGGQILGDFRSVQTQNWTTDDQIVNTSYASSEPFLLTTNDDTVYALWVESDDSDTDQVLVITRTATAGWSTPIQANDVLTRIGNLARAVDGSGGLHVAWLNIQSMALYYDHFSEMGWGADSQITDTVEGLQSLSVAVDDAGTVYALWRCDEGESEALYYASKPSGDSWGSYAKLVEASAIGDAFMIADGQGNVHVIWEEVDGSVNIYARRLLVGSNEWQSSERINDAVINFISGLSIINDLQGNVHIVWVEEQEYPQPNIGYYDRWLVATESWQEDAVFAIGGKETGYSVEEETLQEIVLAANADDELYVIWRSELLLVGAETAKVIYSSRLSVLPIDQTLAPDCPLTSCSSSQGNWGKPINTGTGNYYYQQTDLSLPTVGMPLYFERTYNSLTSGAYTTSLVYSSTLGYGWTHNLDARLVFSDGLGGEPDTVILEAAHGSRLRFYVNDDGSYDAFPGVLAELAQATANTYTVTAFNQTVYAFDDDGRLHYLEDAHGNVFTYTYQNDLLSSVTGPLGERFLAFTYDNSDRLIQVEDPLSRTVQFAYDVNGDLTTVTDVRGLVWTYTYTGTHLLHQITDPDGRIVEKQGFDGQGRATWQQDALGNQLDIEYGPFGVVTITDQLDNTWIEIYDPRGTLIREQTPLGDRSGKRYDEQFQASLLTDENGHPTVVLRNNVGQPEVITDALGATTELVYDNNNLIAILGPGGHWEWVWQGEDIIALWVSTETRYEYDENNNVVMITDTLGNRTTYDYNANGQVIEVVDALNNHTQYAYDAYGQQTAITDAQGTVTTFGYDALGRLITTTVAAGTLLAQTTVNVYDNGDNLIETIANYADGTYDSANPDIDVVTRYGYDAVGRRVLVTDTLGYVTHSEYDAAGQLVTVTANYTTAGGQNYLNQYNIVTEYGYDAAGRPVWVTDTLNHASYTGYDAAGRVVSTVVNYVDGVYDPAYPDQDIVAAYGYDPAGQRTWVTDTLGYVARTWYDELGRVVAATANYSPTLYPQHGSDRAWNLTTEYGYDAVGNQVWVTDTLGRATYTEYDVLNRPITATANYTTAGGQNHLDLYNLVTRYGYDALGNQVWVTDTLGRVARTEYDSLNRPITITANYTSAGGQNYLGLYNLVTVYAYDRLGSQTVVADTAGRTVEYGYDRMGRAVTVTNTLGYTTAAQYDSLGRRTATIDANGHSTTFTYDALGRVIQVTNGAGYTTTYVYDALGRQTTLYNGLGQPTYLGYDALGRTTLITNALQHAVETTYDGAGRKTAVEDANGVVTRYAYDPRAQLIQVIENYVSGSASDRQTNVTTQYAYDLAGNRTAFADALSHTTVYTYDVLGQLTATSDPLGHTSVYTYDVRGLRSAEMDPEARTTTYTYDARDRLTQRANADETVSYAYDVLGQRTAMTDTTGATRYDYDDLGRVLTVTYPSGDAVGYRYDRAGNRTQLIYPDGKTVAYAYNAANWLSTVTDWNSDVTTYTYNAAGMLVGVERPNGIQTAYSYDDAGRLAVLRHTQGSDLLAVYTYTLDAAGNRTHVIEQVRQPVEGGLAQGGTAEDVLAAYGLGQENSDQDELPPDQAGRSPLSMDAGRHWLASPTAWSGNRQIEPAGPPALVSVAVEPSQLPADGESQAVVLVYVTDADGLPVQDGTPVAVKTTAGWLSAEEGQTERGLLRLTLTAPDRPVEGTITALVGELKGEATIQFVQASGLALNVSGQSDKSTGGELRPGLEIAEVMERLRNPLREDGQGGWQVKNAHYQATFDQTGVAFALQGQDRAEKDAPEGKDASADEGQLPALHVRLERVRLGETVLYDAAGEKAQAMPSVTGNQAIFQHWPGFEENYRAGDGVLQQTFTLAELPDVDLSAAGDLVVEVVVETDLQARLMSKRQGILFSRAGNESAPLLAYSGALVRDAGGQEMLADLKLDDAVEIYRSQKPGYRLSIVVPGAWLAEAEFPLVIDPLIGDPFLASDPRPQQKELAVAYNPAQDEYLVVWCGYDTGGADCDLQAQRVLSDGIKVGSVITIAQAAGEQREPAVAYNSDNQEYLVVWNDTRNDADGDIYAQRLSITGTLLGSAVVVAETALEEGHPALAYNPVDDVYLAVWHMYIGDDYDIVGRLISASGTLSGTAFAVDDSWQWDLRPDVTYNGSAGAAGEFLVVWDRGWDRIYGQRLSGLGVQLDNSGTAGNEALSDVAFLINDAASDQVYARLAANGETGTYLVVWTDYRSGYSDIYGQMISPTGTLSGTELAIVTNGDDQDTPDVAYNTVRQVYLVGWNNAGDWDVYGQRVTAGGALTGSAVNLSNANGSQFDAALAYNDDNDEWLVVWQDWRWDTLVVYGQRVSGSGSLSGTAFAIGPYVLDAYRPWVAYNEATQEYLVVWEDYRNGNADVYGQRMTQAGMPSGDNFRISSSSAAGDQTAPRVASGGANGYLVVWTDYRSDGSGDVYGQVVSTTGALSGTNFSIVTHSDVQAAPSVAYGAQRGEYLVVWEDYRGSSYDIYGRRVTAGGALSGSEIAVTTVTYAQRYPALAYNGDRDAFVAVWSDKKYSAAHDYDVYGQVVSASGSLSGTVYAVFGTTGTQYRPSIAYWSGGVYWVLWRDGRDYATNNYDIYGRTLNGSGAPSGTVVALAATSGAQDLPVVAPLAGSDAGFFALWADYRDEDEADLYGQRLNSDGTLRGGNLLLLDGWGYPSGLSLAAHTAQPEALFVWDWWGDIVAQRYGLLVADFAASPVSGGVPLTVTFTNTSTPTAGITGYLWNFGDGVTSTITNPVHCYTPTGVYTVSLTVSGAGETETLTRTNYITVGIVPQSPVADFSATPTSGNAPLTATFTNTSTNATSYEWNFGDGVTSTLENPTHTYTQADVYTVSLAATGPGGMDVLTRTGYITVTDGAAYTVTTRTITYTYDPLNRLTEAEYDDGTFYEYEYDAVGNRKAVTTTAGTVAYQYDAANRLTQVGGVSYTWDDAGNLLNDGLFTYTWDAAGRLVMAQNITHTVIYTYNGDGVRVAQNADGVETRWVQTLASHCTSYNRSSNSVCGLPQVLVETRGIESTLYVYGPSRLAQMKTDSTGWFLGDALGSVRQLVDDSGDVVLARDYDSYGQVMAESGTGESGYGFTGEQYDAATELLFLRARYYALGTGRFLSWDPWQGSIQQPSSLHKYLYTGDNPIKLVDPSGRQECEGRPGEPCHSVLKAWPTHLYERSTCWEKVGMHRCTGYYTPIEAELTDTEKVSLPVLDKRQSPDQLVNVVVPKRFYDRASIQGTGKLSQEGYEGLYLAMWKNPVEFTDRVWVSMKGGKPIAGKTAAINTGKSVHLALGDEIYLPEKSVRLQVNDNGTGDPTIADPRYWIDIYLGEGDAERNQVGSNLVGRNFTDYMVYKKTWNVFCEFPCPPPSELIVP